jgi:hypothetical protein
MPPPRTNTTASLRPAQAWVSLSVTAGAGALAYHRASGSTKPSQLKSQARSRPMPVSQRPDLRPAASNASPTNANSSGEAGGNSNCFNWRYIGRIFALP